MKITTVIPAYKSKYLLELLASLNHQTVLPERVIFSDDSPDGVFAAMLGSEPIKSAVAQLNVEVIRGPRRGAHANWAHCIEHWGGRTELLHLLCDDDIIYPRFYERHLQAHLSGHFALTASRRWYANETGQPVKYALSVPQEIDQHPSRILSLDQEVIWSTNIGRAANWLGEVSNVVVRAETAEYIRARYYDGILIAGLEDIGAFCLGTLHGPLGYINEHMGFFRQSAEQNSSQSYGPPLKMAMLAYLSLAIIGRKVGMLQPAHVAYNFETVGNAILYHYRNEDDLSGIRAVLPELIAQSAGSEDRFLAQWESYFQGLKAAGKA